MKIAVTAQGSDIDAAVDLRFGRTRYFIVVDTETQEVLVVDIANEERVHAGEFLRLLKYLTPDEEKFYAEGAGEVDEEIKKLGLK